MCQRRFHIQSSQTLSVHLLRVNPDHLYVYEDTLDRSGRSGQAKVRDEPNAHGIPVRKTPGLMTAALFSDQPCEFEAVTDALRRLYRTGQNRILVFPHTGIGRGPYGVAGHSPRLYDHLCGILDEHFGYQQPALSIRAENGHGPMAPSTPQQLFAQVCTQGGINMASLIAEQHGLSLQELKAMCCMAGAELMLRSQLYPLHRPVYRWASET